MHFNYFWINGTRRWIKSFLRIIAQTTKLASPNPQKARKIRLQQIQKIQKIQKLGYNKYIYCEKNKVTKFYLESFDQANLHNWQIRSCIQ